MKTNIGNQVGDNAICERPIRKHLFYKGLVNPISAYSLQPSSWQLASSATYKYINKNYPTSSIVMEQLLNPLIIIQYQLSLHFHYFEWMLVQMNLWLQFA